MSKKSSNFAAESKMKITMLTVATSQGVYLNIPRTDWNLLTELARKFGWQTQTSEQLLDNFIAGRPKVEDMSEEDIMDEVRAVRYAK